MSNSKIEWTDATWNPVTGCTKISPGCEHCYAERMARRLSGRWGYPEMPHHFDVTLRPERLNEPLKWRKPRMVFVCSMSDLFHRDVPDEFVFRVFETIRMAQRHTFQVLTKRPERMAELLENYQIPFNLWTGVTVCNKAELWKVNALRHVKSPRFISFEPLLSDMGNIDLTGIDWVIVGGETGPGARAVHPNWVRSIRDQCVGARVPFFFKKWGDGSIAVNTRTQKSHLVDGKEWRQYPLEMQQCHS